MKEISLDTGSKCEFLEITDRVRSALKEEGLEQGAVLVVVPHTTAAVTINESYDSSVRRDIIKKLNDIVPFEGDYSHREGNSPAHIKSSLVGCDQLVPVENGGLSLGTWQGLFFCEFDGPRTRKVRLQFLQSL
ncbi:secondary thiamine-phosphate synthase enzyme YjbQ [Halarsenatibacter silvermanii]|uniref:Secondary thiamine-phosphate synthase enzyme n=1 Tax=Halarsenatibacter silvermanii TaxID=321763 RepID=A0A1G9SWT7_9FIRM|nr:secondary thiamine-phosphate synthase enzyme YjbQ [Halarsenatibacter silvermanii]SDM39906.1 secondary thiamine-phosphate synthase enzyme [Halarsenatibacter silvermanii]